jgi:hypothetical protein
MISLYLTSRSNCGRNIKAELELARIRLAPEYKETDCIVYPGEMAEAESFLKGPKYDHRMG